MTHTPTSVEADETAQVAPTLPAVPGGHVPAVLDQHAETARQRGWTYVNLDVECEIPGDVLQLMAAGDARRHNAIPIRFQDRAVLVACGNPDDLELRSRISPLFSGNTVRLAYANPAAIRRKIEQVYSAAQEAASLAAQRRAAQGRGPNAVVGGDLGRVQSGQESNNVRLLRLIIEQALRDDASDIHVEPTERRLEVRYRVDGKLFLAGDYSLAQSEELINLIKVESQMKTDIKMIPDSGVMVFKQDGHRDVDIRVETAPTAWGQSAVMRLQANIWRPLSSLGLSEENQRRYGLAITQPNGIVLATGPTGSGKSTTMYASISELIDPTRKIITLENPIEYKAPAGISQISVNEAQGMTFGSGMRSILRQDPDVVLVGEIRDSETALTALDLSMAGRLIFSTLHTNDAIGAIGRLGRMGADPFLLADNIRCVIGQRLVGRLCDGCKVQRHVSADEIARMGFNPDRAPETFFVENPDGCEECHHRGFLGRAGAHEVVLLSPDLADAIAAEQPHSVLTRLAVEAGMVPLREDGFRLAAEGKTTLAEVNGNTLRRLA